MPKRPVKGPRIRIRVPVPKPGFRHDDKRKYNRKRKHRRPGND